MCVWGQRPTKPVCLQNFCHTHSFMFLEFVLTGYFTHVVKLALVVCTPTELYVIFKVSTTGQYYINGWVSRGLLYFETSVSSAYTMLDVIQFLLTLPSFELYALLYGTTLPEVAVLPNFTIPLYELHNSQGVYNNDALVAPDSAAVVPIQVLALPEVTAYYGSNTPDPRLPQGGTLTLWDSITKNKFPVQKLRYGHLLHQKKTVASEFKNGGGETGASAVDGQFHCDL